MEIRIHHPRHGELTVYTADELRIALENGWKREEPVAEKRKPGRPPKVKNAPQ